MATTKNAGSLFLAAANPRLLTAANAAIILGTTSPLFHVNIAGVPDITSITVSAQLIALEGAVTFSCAGGTLTSISGNTAALLYSNMSANIATITATLTYRGQSFTATTKITKVLDAASAGTNGLSNAIAYAYQRSAAAPTLSPGDITYDFGVGGISFPTTLANGWLKTIPTGTQPLYVTTASASNTAATDAIAGSEWSGAVVLAQDGANGTQGLSVATVYIYQRTTTSTAPILPSTSTVFTFSTGVLTGLNNGWTTTIPAATGGGFLWVSTATASNTTATDTLLSSEWAAAQLLSQDGTGVGSPGPAGNSVATVVLYQWSTVVPSNPTGVATFTWASASTTAYSVSDGWSYTVPPNPGSPGIKLFLASVPITAPAGTTTSTCTFSGATIAAYSQNGATGAPGIKTATVSAYQWGLSAPTTTGTATYTWSAGTYNTPPSTGWTAAKGSAPGSGYTLYEASVRLVDSTGAGTSSVDWTTASIAGIAYQGTSGGAGSQGASAKRAYVLINGNTLALTPTTFTASGTAFPTTGTWGETNAWQATPPSPAAGQTVFQSDGIFDPVPNQTVWNVPYLSQLKVGSLSAISANFGAMSAGSIDLGTGTLSWHVDTSGSMWSGASTYTAAPFKVSTAGDVVMKSFLLQTPGGTTILSAGGLTSGFEAPGTLNSAIALGADGSLSGGATGQATLSGMGLKNWRVVSVGNSATTAPAAAGIYLNGVLMYTPPRSYLAIGISRATGAVLFSQTYDVVGNGANTSGRNAATMAADLNNQQSDRIVVVCTFDEPQGGRTSDLMTAMYRCGASRTVFGSPQFKYRSAYILVGIGGCGEGNGAESYQGTIDSDTNAWCDVGFSIVNNNLVGVSTSYTPKTLADYSYTGDLNANNTTNTNQLTDGAGLGNTALWSNIAGQTNAPANNATVGAPSGTNVGSTAATTVESGAANGATALAAVNDATTGLAQRLRANADNVLGGILSADVVSAPAGFRAGTLTWNAAGTRTGGYGVAITPLGLVGYTSAGVLTFAIDATTGAATFGGALSAATGTFGAVSIAAGGSLSSGQTAYATGAGYWLENIAGVVKFSLGDATTYLRWTPSGGLELKLAALSVSLSGTLSTSVANGHQSYGSKTATVTGDTTGLKYSWVVNGYSSTNGTTVSYTLSGGSSNVAGMNGTATNDVITATVTCTVTNAGGFSASASFTHSPIHGTP